MLQSKPRLYAQADGQQLRKVEWPDGAEGNRRSTDCERGRGSDYGHLRIERKLSQAEIQESRQPKAESMETPALEIVPVPGPLADLSVALIGFQRDHEASNSDEAMSSGDQRLAHLPRCLLNACNDYGSSKPSRASHHDLPYDKMSS